MPRSGPRQIYQYSKEFKLATVRLSQVSGLQVKAVATALGIHPFMLSKWRKDVRDGTLRGRLPKAARLAKRAFSRRQLRSVSMWSSVPARGVESVSVVLSEPLRCALVRVNMTHPRKSTTNPTHPDE